MPERGTSSEKRASKGMMFRFSNTQWEDTGMTGEEGSETDVGKREDDGTEGGIEEGVEERVSGPETVGPACFSVQANRRKAVTSKASRQVYVFIGSLLSVEK